MNGSNSSGCNIRTTSCESRGPNVNAADASQYWCTKAGSEPSRDILEIAQSAERVNKWRKSTVRVSVTLSTDRRANRGGNDRTVAHCASGSCGERNGSMTRGKCSRSGTGSARARIRSATVFFLPVLRYTPTESAATAHHRSRRRLKVSAFSIENPSACKTF